jgi:hypothetical protein
MGKNEPRGSATAKPSGRTKARKPGQRNVMLILSEEEHKRLRVAAAYSDVSMSAFCRAATLKAIDVTMAEHRI